MAPTTSQAREIRSLKKQLGAAIAMVLVAAVALGSATFAWFVNNNRVEATGVDLGTTTSVPNLYIEKAGTTTSTANAVADTAAVKGQKLYPVSTVDGNAFFETLSWTSGTEGSGHALANSYQEAQAVGDDEVAKYAEYTFTLGVQNGAMDIYFDADSAKTYVKAADSTIGTAGRWAISFDNGNSWKLFKADAGSVTGTGYVTDNGATNFTGDWAVADANTVKEFTYENLSSYSASYNAANGSVEATGKKSLITLDSTKDGKSTVEVKVCFWFEGCDKDCVSEIAGTGFDKAITGNLGFVGIQTLNSSIGA